MKVLITVPYKNDGGIYIFCETIIPALRALGNDIDVCKRGIKKNRKNKIIIIIEQFIDYLVFIKKLLTNKYDLIFINTSLSKYNCTRDGLFIIISKLFNKKILLFIHGFQEKCLQNKILLKGYFFSDAIIVLANEFKIKLEYAGYKKNIEVLFNPVNQEILDYSSLDSLEERKNREPKNILFLSRIEEEKGIMIAIKAFNVLIPKYPNIQLFIAGNGTMLEFAKNYVINNKIKNVHFLGFINGKNKIELLKKSDIFLFPTYYYEGLPISILEAITFGLPVITRPVGGIKDFFKNEEMGYLIESKSPQDFANAIELLIKSKNLYNINDNNFKFAKQNFQPAQIAKKLNKFMKEIING